MTQYTPTTKTKDSNPTPTRLEKNILRFTTVTTAVRNHINTSILACIFLFSTQ